MHYHIFQDIIFLMNFYMHLIMMTVILKRQNWVLIVINEVAPKIYISSIFFIVYMIMKWKNLFFYLISNLKIVEVDSLKQLIFFIYLANGNLF